MKKTIATLALVLSIHCLKGVPVLAVCDTAGRLRFVPA